ncbi:MAG: ribosome-associated translation inhibitor RaiA [Candidatus Chaera renei]|uniref:Ribosome-associated translation inhibitor RaiA n=1 Tax=Candidatus Chaera renei TaxID=2506947 RepID=A0A4Q0AJT2_9BACT|nr:MAG: ribosome-associated translation inhibitor RaiA [Candidatus Chaera renei]
MIAPINIVGMKLELDDDIKRYVTRKIGRLDRYLPRHARQSVHAQVRLRDANNKHGNKYECEVVLHLPSETLTARDFTLNIFAAVDIVEAKLKNQLKRYKEQYGRSRVRRAANLIRRLKGRFSKGTTV